MLIHTDVITLLSALIAAVAVPAAALVGLAITGMTKRLAAWLDKHGLAAEAQMANATAAAVAAEVNTSASVIAGRIDRGELDPTNRAAWEAMAQQEVPLIKQRLPALAGAAIPTAAKILTDVMAAVDAKTVASPTINAPPPPAANDPTDQITQAAETLTKATAAMARVGIIVPAPAPAAGA